MMDWIKSGGLIFIALFFGFMLGVISALSITDTECLQRKCDKTNGKYDFCQAQTIWKVRESK